ncbi:hypothetical protein [Nafulsella turpanensis]|uniref:hypothetical protein n=1 Tax=Nafulsella turpanensis TaxID=1265690 RepID=UPI00034BA6C5|nr:hypothetical protein [Nafulsella turpanensis]
MAKKVVPQQGEKKEEGEILSPAIQGPDQEYTPEELLGAWKEYAEQLKAAGRQGEYVILKETPDLAENHAVLVRVTNSVQQDFFEKARAGAQVFLRQKLRNSQISLSCKMVKEEEGKRLYTAQEKFGYLLQKYPQLQELKNRLGLEADF